MKKENLPRGIRFDPSRRGKQYLMTFGGEKPKLFATREEAEKALRDAKRQAKEFGKASFEYDPDKHAKLKQIEGKMPEGVSFDDVLKFWNAHNGAGECPTVEKAVEEFIRESEGVSERHFDSLSGRLRKLVYRFGPEKVSAVSAAMVSAWLEPGSEGAPYQVKARLTPEQIRAKKREDKRRQYVRRKGKLLEPYVEAEPKFVPLAKVSFRTVKNWKIDVGTFFHWAVNKWKLPPFEFEESRREKIANDAPSNCEVFKLDELKGIFADLASRPESRKFVPYFALQAFAGIRHEEMARIRWDAFDFTHETITLPGEMVKNGKDWVMMAPCWKPLFRMLAKYRGEAERVPTEDDLALNPSEVPFVLCPADKPETNLHKRWVKLGILKKWPKNGLRHSFATFHASLSQPTPNFGTTAYLLRHSSSELVEENYLNILVPKPIAEEYFSIEV